MAQSSQALRSRIKSVNSTRKITKAMEMIANAKLFRQRSRMEANREYSHRLKVTVEDIVTHNPDVKCDYVREASGDKSISIVFTSDLGLCGGYNSNIIKHVKESLNKEDPVYVIGTTGYKLIKNEGFNVINEEPISSDRLDYNQLKEIMQDCIDRYLHYEVDEVKLLYTRFVNTMSFKPATDILLPCELKGIELEEAEKEEESKYFVDTLFEPNPQKILNKLIPMMVIDVAYSIWMETTTAEQGSRRMAMKTATDNADELSEELLLEYNKVRQANITQEITEIVGGSEAV